MMNYSLDEMIKNFTDHANRNDERMKLDRQKFPDAEWVKNEFNISRALLRICEEIKILKDG